MPFDESMIVHFEWAGEQLRKAIARRKIATAADEITRLETEIRLWTRCRDDLIVKFQRDIDDDWEDLQETKAPPRRRRNCGRM